MEGNRIGYQGYTGSHAEQAVKKFITKNRINNPLVHNMLSSKSVINALVSKKVDYGIVPYKNNISGIIKETERALKWLSSMPGLNKNLILVEEYLISINIGLYGNTSNPAYIKKLLINKNSYNISGKFIKKHLKGVKIMPIDDASISVKFMSQGKFGSDIAIICSKELSNQYKIPLIASGITDKKNPITEYRVYKYETN